MSSVATSEARDVVLARLAEERQRLGANFAARGSGLAHARALATALDEAVGALLPPPAAGDDWTVLAVGGYGRGEVSPHSDVDLLVLSRHANSEAERVATTLSYALWDAKLEAAPSVRDLADALYPPADDFARATSYLQGRYLAGDAALAAEFNRRFLENLRRNGGREFLRHLRAEDERRHGLAAATAHGLEPDLKEGRGGLRDGHSLLWAGRVGLGVGTTAGLLLAGYLAEDEADELEAALDYLWLVRHRLHYAAGRRADQLYFPYQEGVAAFLGYGGHNGHTPAETLMRQLNAHGAAVVRAASAFWEHVEDELLGTRGRGWGWAARLATPRRQAAARTEQLLVQQGRLTLAPGAPPPNGPAAALAAFAEAGRQGVRLGHSLLRATRAMLAQSAGEAAWQERDRENFLSVLRAGDDTPALLEQMADCGILGYYLPEWQTIRYLARQDIYHRHTVDRHSALVVRELHRLASGESVEGALGARVAADLADFDVLLLAGLLHDLGKGQPGDHTRSGAALVAVIGERLGLSAERVETLAFLVREHLALARAATRRDLDDPALVRHVGRLAGSPERLRLLYLLTVADSVATGPSAWNEWKATLLRELFLRVLRSLEGDEAGAGQATLEEQRATLARVLATRAGKEAAARFAAAMPAAYLLTQPAEAAQRHLDLLARSPQTVRLDVQPAADCLCHELTLAAPDRPGLLWRVCGVFALHGLNVLEARIFTDAQGQALDIFRLSDAFEGLAPEAKWPAVQRDLELALEGRLALAYRLARKLRPYAKKRTLPERPARLDIDNASAAEHTVVEVHAQDRLGLLYAVARAFDELGLSIHLAKVATRGPEAVDAFYVRDQRGHKVTDPEQIRELEQAVLFALESMDR
ncbi:MAG: [protein-PII] uridylyltransferase [Chloroflexota bacterium]